MSRLLFVLLSVLVLSITSLPADAVVIRKQLNIKGDFVVIGNTLAQDCRSAVPKPVVGKVGACPAPAYVDDTGVDVIWVADKGVAEADVKWSPTGPRTTAAKTTALLSLPVGATVSYAQLYWFGITDAMGDSTARLQGPGNLSVPITAGKVWGSTVVTPHFEATADVTAHVQKAGAGAYTVSDVELYNPARVATVGDFQFGGWFLVVFYSKDTDRLQQLTLMDGVDSTTTRGTILDFTLSGFQIPQGGFNAKLGIAGFGGSETRKGDRMKVNDRDLTDAQNPADNFFNNTRSTLGKPVSVPGDLPQLTGGVGSMGAFDLDVVDISTYLAPKDTKVNFKSATTGETFSVGMLVTGLPTQEPNLGDSPKTFTNITTNNNELNRPGDVITYSIKVQNQGTDNAINVVLRDNLPTGVDYVPSSLKIGGVAKTDGAGDDQAEYDAANRRIVARLGVGADKSVGGRVVPMVLPTDAIVVTFQVKIRTDAQGVISNRATLSGTGESAGLSYTWQSGPNDKPADFVVACMAGMCKCVDDRECPQFQFCEKVSGKCTDSPADVEIDSSVAPNPVSVLENTVYTISVSNNGPGLARNAKVSFPVPLGAQVLRVDAGTGWSCVTLANPVTCTRSASLQPNEGAPDIFVTVKPPNSSVMKNTITVSTTSTDPNLMNNSTGEVIVPITPDLRADLAVKMVTAPDPADVTKPVTYTISVTNYGPAEAKNVSLSYTIPLDGTVSNIQSGTTWTCQTQSGRIDCTKPSQIVGNAIPIVITVMPKATAKVLRSEARVASDSPDPKPENNTTGTVLTPLTADMRTDLSVAMTGTPNPASAISPISYVINVNNGGPAVAKGVKLTYTLPAMTSVQDIVAGNGWTCTAAGTRVDCALGFDLEPGGAPEITINVTKPGAAGMVTATAVVSGGMDPNLANNTANVTIPVNDPRADLAIVSVTATPDPVDINGTLVYTIKVRNNGPASSRIFVDYIVPDVLNVRALTPAQQAALIRTTSPGWKCFLDLNYSPTTVYFTCNPLTLPFAPGDAPDLQIQVQVKPTKPAPLRADFEIYDEVDFFSTGYALDPVPANNKASLVTGLNDPNADLAIKMAASPDPAQIGQSVTYTLSVNNAGPGTAKGGVVVTFNVPDLLSVNSVDGTTFACGTAGKVITCRRNTDLPPGPAPNININLQPPPTLAMAMVQAPASAEVQPQQPMISPDPDPSDNKAALTISLKDPRADVQLAVSQNPMGKVRTDQPVTFVANVRNAGPSSATGIGLTVTLSPTGATFKEIRDGNGWSCDTTMKPEVIECTYSPTLQVGDAPPVTIVALPPPMGLVMRTKFDLATDSQDPNDANNHAQFTNDLQEVPDMATPPDLRPGPVLDLNPEMVIRKQMNLRGNFTIFGNTLGHDCRSALAKPVVGKLGNCPAAQNSADTGIDVLWVSNPPQDPQGALADQSFSQTGSRTSAARSSALLAIPAGATIEYAHLYWFGRTEGQGDDLVRLEGPAGLNIQLTSEKIWGSSTPALHYQASLEVTSLVKKSGPGLYRLSDVDIVNPVTTLTNGDFQFAGWYIVVFYKVAGERMRQMTLLEGLGVTTPASSVLDKEIGGFQVPQGSFDAKLGLVGFGGSESRTGDTVLVNGKDLLDPLSPGNNIFNNSRGNLGKAYSVPGDLPQLTGAAGSLPALDIDQIDITGYLAPKDTKLTLKGKTTNPAEVFSVGAVVTGLPTQEPDLSESQKTFLNITTNDTSNNRPGDTIEYSIKVPNKGSDAATQVVLRDALGTALEFVAGSIKLDGVSMTDGAADDQAEYDAMNRTVVARLGAGADKQNGGRIKVLVSPTDAVVLSFRVKLRADAQGVIPNQAIIDGTSESSGETYSWKTGNGTGTGLPTEIRVSCMAGMCKCVADNECSQYQVCDRPTGKCVDSPADVEVGATVLPNPVSVLETATYTMAVSNGGPGLARGIKLSFPVPTGAMVTKVTPGMGWVCQAMANPILCTRAASLEPNQGTPDIQIVVKPGAPPSMANTISVTTTSTDPNLMNNTTGLITVPVTPDLRADVSIRITANPDPGDVTKPEVYTIDVSNAGPATANNVSVSWLIPVDGNVTNIAPGMGWNCMQQAGTLLCSRPDLPPGMAPSIVVTLTPKPTAKVLRTEGSVSTDSPDPMPDNNRVGPILTALSPDSRTDLALTMSVRPNPGSAIDPLQYTLKVSNGGPAIAKGVQVTFTGQAMTKVKEVNTASEWRCTQMAETASCDLQGDLPPGSAPDIEVVLAAPGFGGMLTSSAQVKGGAMDPNLANNSASVSVNLNDPRADIAILSATASPDPVNLNATLTYTLKIANKGPATSKLYVDYIVPESLNVRSLPPADQAALIRSTSPGWKCFLDLEYSPTTVYYTCNPTTFPLPVGNAPDLQIQVQVKPIKLEALKADFEVYDEVDFYSTGYALDPVPGNNKASLTTPLNDPRADLSIKMDATPERAALTDPVVYTLTVTNLGPGTAKGGCSVTYTAPELLTITKVDSPSWNCTQMQKTVNCTRQQDLQPGPAPDITITTMPPAMLQTPMAQALARAEVVSLAPMTSPDPDPKNNKVTVATGLLDQNADVTVLVQSTPEGTVPPSQPIIYTVLVKNSGPASAPGTTLTVTLPGDVVIQDVKEDSGFLCTVEEGQERIIKCIRDKDLPPGTVPAVVITVTAPQSGMEVRTKFEVLSKAPDQNDSGNRLTVVHGLRELPPDMASGPVMYRVAGGGCSLSRPAEQGETIGASLLLSLVALGTLGRSRRRSRERSQNLRNL